MQRFESKKDWWLLAIIYSSSIASLFAAIAVLSNGIDLSAVLMAGFIFLVGTVFPLWLVGSTYYCLDAEKLIINSGPFKWQIFFAEIEQIEETRNPIASPALSLDRVAIHYQGRGRVLVSPDDKAAFCSGLRALSQGGESVLSEAQQ